MVQPSPTASPSPTPTIPGPRGTEGYFPEALDSIKGDGKSNTFSGTGIPSKVPLESQGLAYIPRPGVDVPFPGTRPTPGRAGRPPRASDPAYNQWVSKADASNLFTDLPDWQQNMFAGMAAAKGGNSTAESIYKKYVGVSANRSKGENGEMITPGELAYSDISSGKAPYAGGGDTQAGPGTTGSRAYSGPVSRVTQLGDEDIRRMANDESMNLIGRDVTDAEFKKIMTAVRRAEARNPDVTSGKGANRTTVSGLSAETRAEIIREKTAGFISRDVALAEEATIYGEASKTMNDLRSWAQANGVTLTDNSIRQYTQQVIKGDRTADDIKADLRRTYVAGSYPAWSERINAGEDIADIAAPYRQTMANLLEVQDQDITLTDNTLRSALQGVGADGKPAVVPIYEFEKQVRKDPRWQYTNNAQSDYSRAAYDVLNMFGLR
jgi:hypothetical protein